MHADRNTAIALAAILAVWFFGSLIAAKGIFSQETAAWVQAIGAVAAIIAAGWAAQLPLKQELKRRRDAEAHLLSSIEIAGILVGHDLAQTRGAASNKNIEAFNKAIGSAKSDGAKALGRYLDLPITNWPSVSLYVSAAELLRCASEYRSRAEGVASYIQYDGSLAHLAKANDALTEALDDFRREVYFERYD